MKITPIILFSALIISLVSCYRSPDDTVFYEDLDMVTTRYTETDYPNKYLTFYVADSFGVVSNVDDIGYDEINGSDPEFVEFRRNIRKTITDNMRAYGYKDTIPLDTNGIPIDTPDLYIPITVTYINTSGVSWTPIYGGYPGGWWGWGGYPSYGWGGYWYYYPTWVPQYYSYDNGSIHMDLMDLSTAQQYPGDTIWYVENVWNMSVNGLMRNSTGEDRNKRIEAAINQGFEQSPYLSK